MTIGGIPPAAGAGGGGGIIDIIGCIAGAPYPQHSSAHAGAHSCVINQLILIVEFDTIGFVTEFV